MRTLPGHLSDLRVVPLQEFAMRMKEVYEEAEVILKKSQEEMKKYTNGKRNEMEEY